MMISGNSQSAPGIAGYVGEIIAAAMRACRAIGRGAHAHYRRRQQAIRIYDELCRLDDRALRDIGIHRNEIESVAAELVGTAAPTRRRVGRA